MNSFIRKKKALITGIRGQDGSYMAEKLLGLGYQIYGTTHIEASPSTLRHYSNLNISIEKLDLGNTVAVRDLVEKIQPDEIYNLAARSSSAQLFDDPVETAEINGLAVVRFLEAIRQSSPNSRFCQASSSEIFAGCNVTPQDECTAMNPVNAYGAAKAYAANIVSAYRSRFGLFATTAILYNHESPRRGMDYVTRKITQTVAKISLGLEDKLVLGTMDSYRDWGFAGDYAEAMWLMLQQSSAEDYVIATGEKHSVREFCDIAFSCVSLDYRKFVQIDPNWLRGNYAIQLCGNPEKAQKLLNWQPTISFPELVRKMVESDLNLLQSSVN